MQRIYDFFRRHPTWVDSFWAVVLLGVCAVWVVVDRGPSPETSAAAVLFSFALATVVALRRRAPERMLLLAIGTGLAQLALNVHTNPGDAAFVVIIYTCASNGARWSSRLALVAGLAAAPVSMLRWPPHNRDSTIWTTLIQTFFLAVIFALSWVVGDRLRTRRAYYAELEERNARLNREREAQSKAAVAAERARIARELHDVVAHNVSVMVVQADGAAYVLDAAPDQAKQALATISTTGRQALAEMRRLLGLLRAGDDAGGEYVPQPGVDQLGDLIDQVRGAGLPVRFEVAGDARPLSSGVELTAYRIVQEALTNVRKHGGDGASASVQLGFRDAALDLLIEDDGRGARHELYQQGGRDGLGQGLIGMRERIGMVGGTLDAGPRPGGGFRISAVLPLKPGR
ncbi:Signal transduction histidine kinase [Streptomyces sp. DvalAA-14]|uniref:sensor histidine kinase n=1 Tax=unclassified Streptomyces TaxID=2593676 RepID=UPI00081BB7C3|nr:sensor histidine kinase [Streptomyces sp. DvalAA-14]MYS20103.1 sensor histidine kinase [Streptomyces sp. SID4948]SCD60908.1 Signal transduction histidine kinase [Streptomyces sp. DvalAA-14]